MSLGSWPAHGSTASVAGKPRNAPLGVLHVIHRMDCGGIETWLMNVLRNIDRQRFRFDFLVYTTSRCAYDDQVRTLGSRIIPCTPPSHAISHVRHLRHLLMTEGPYEVIHVHGASEAGNTLRTAAWAGIPIRIAHSHNVKDQGPLRFRSYVYRAINRRWMIKYMTHGLGCSQEACTYLFGPRWRSDARCRVLYYGMDWEPYRPGPEDATDATTGLRTQVREMRVSLGLPEDALVIGHVGRFAMQKNHSFWLQVASAIAVRRDDARFLLVGDGELRPTIQDQVRRRGLEDRFVFTGVRSDIPALMQAMDVFLFPSHFEGLGIVLLEAQASGLPCVVSDSIPLAATVIEDQMSRLSLELSPERWADVVLEVASREGRKDRRAAWEAVAHSPFSLSYCIDRLTEIYQGQGQKTGASNDRAVC